jgi:hypothetical protein
MMKRINSNFHFRFRLIGVLENYKRNQGFETLVSSSVYPSIHSEEIPALYDCNFATIYTVMESKLQGKNDLLGDCYTSSSTINRGVPNAMECSSVRKAVPTVRFGNQKSYTRGFPISPLTLQPLFCLPPVLQLVLDPLSTGGPEILPCGSSLLLLCPKGFS